MPQTDAIAGVGRRADPIRLRQGVDPNATVLTAEEAFLLSRIDGVLTVDSLLKSAGLPEQRSAELLRALREKGLVSVGEGDAAGPAPSRYRGVIFNPADLSEEVDLDLELRKELLFLEARLDRLTHYEVLGVRPGTPPDELRRRYHELTRRFHPDRYFGKRLGSYAPRLSRAFQALQSAWETLSDPSRKAEYDRVTDVPLTVDEVAEIEARQEQRLRDERRAEERRERLRRRNPLFRQKQKVVELVREAEKAASQEDWRSAANLYRLAATHEPGDPGLTRLADEMAARSASTRSAELLDRARAAETLGNADQSMGLLREAAEVDQKNAKVQVAYARALLARKRTKEAVEVGRQATRAGPRTSDAWTVYGVALLALGEKKEAKAAFQRAVDLDPTADEAKEQLKSLRWSLF